MPGHSKHTVLCNLDPSEDEAARHEAIVNDFFFWERCMKRMYVEILDGEDEEWRFCIRLFLFFFAFIFFYDDFRH